MTDHKNVYMALAAAQANMGTVVKGATNPAFKSKYADLADVVAVVVPALSAQGVALYHAMMRDDAGLSMRTTISHGPSDTHIHCDVPLIVDRQNMQGMKSAVTYAKRIGVESLTGIAPEDDDGNAAAASAPTKAEPKRQEHQPDAIPAEAINIACNSLRNAETLDQLAAIWSGLPRNIQAHQSVIATKDERKAGLTKNADLGGDNLPY